MSTIEQAYEQVGGNYQDVLKRLMNEALVRRFMGKSSTTPASPR